MGRKPEVRWHKQNKCYTSAVGPISEKTGRRKPVYFHGIASNQKAKAQAALEAYLRERDAEEATVGDDLTFGDLCDMYLSYSEVTAKKNTYAGHRKVLRLVRKFRHRGKPYADKPATEMTATDLGRLVEAWAKEAKKPSYISRMVASVQAVYNWAANPLPERDPERLIESNPLRGYSSPHCKVPHAPDRHIDDETVARFLRWAWARARIRADLSVKVKKVLEDRRNGIDAKLDPMYELRFDRLTVWLIRVSLLTGTRPAELCVAEWTDFKPRASEQEDGTWWGTITLDPKRWKSGSKLKKPRVIYLPPRAVKIVELIRLLPDHHPRFIWTHRRGPRSTARGAEVTSQGEPWNTNALSRKVKTWRREAIEAGIPLVDEGEMRFTMYMLRHNAVRKILAENNGDTYLAGQLVGSSAAMVQKVYGSSEEKRMISAAAGLAKRKRNRETSS